MTLSAVQGPIDPCRVVPDKSHVSPARAYLDLLVGKRAVIVEDEGITQLQLGRTLRQAGVLVVGTAASGPEGVEVVLRQKPDLVLMDIKMPGEYDGLEAAGRILSQLSICVVMLTAYDDEPHRQRAEILGVHGYVVKPVLSSSLLPALVAAMEHLL